jgi:hypothetical protein
MKILAIDLVTLHPEVKQRMWKLLGRKREVVQESDQAQAQAQEQEQ